MLMNFGPINQSGGERRLNVAFSRAKQHMAVVSSIRHHAITNDYNDGARSLKNYLRYAEALSCGDHAAARRGALGDQPNGRYPRGPWPPTMSSSRPWRRDCANAATTSTSTSASPASVATSPSAPAVERSYRLGILVDTDAYYQNGNISNATCCGHACCASSAGKSCWCFRRTGSITLLPS